MKHSKFLIGLSLMVAMGATQAQTTVAGANSSSQSGAASQAQAGAAGYAFGGGGGAGGGGGSSQLITNNGNTYEAPDLSDGVVSVIIPALTTSNGTCMGSTSGGIGISGFGGSFGSTYTSDPCNVRFNANQMNALGAPELALEMMCSMDDVYEADKRIALRAGTRAKCMPRDEVDNEPTAMAEPVEMKWFEQDEIGAYHVIATPPTDTAMIWGGNYTDMPGGER